MFNLFLGHPNRKAIIMMQKRKMNMRPKSWQKTRGTQTAESRFSKCGFIKSETIKEEDENGKIHMMYCVQMVRYTGCTAFRW